MIYENSKIISKLIFDQIMYLENSNIGKELFEFLNYKSWAMEHGTFTIDLGRESGHTTSVFYLVNNLIRNTNFDICVIDKFNNDLLKNLYKNNKVFKLNRCNDSLLRGKRFDVVISDPFSYGNVKNTEEIISKIMPKYTILLG